MVKGAEFTFPGCWVGTKKPAAKTTSVVFCAGFVEFAWAKDEMGAEPSWLTVVQQGINSAERGNQN